MAHRSKKNLSGSAAFAVKMHTFITILTVTFISLSCSGTKPSQDAEQSKIKNSSVEITAAHDNNEENENTYNNSEQSSGSEKTGDEKSGQTQSNEEKAGDQNGNDNNTNTAKAENNNATLYTKTDPYNELSLISLLKKQSEQGLDVNGNCGGSRILIDNNCYSTLEYCSLLNHSGYTYTPDDDSKSCRLSKNSCKPYQEKKMISIKSDESGGQSAEIEICQDSQEKCLEPDYLWLPVPESSPDKINPQYQQGGQCLMTEQGCQNMYNGHLMTDGSNQCSPTPKYCIEEENKFYLPGSGPESPGRCVYEADYSASESGCREHGMYYNAESEKCYHYTEAGCQSVNHIWIADDQISRLKRLHTQWKPESPVDTFEGDSGVVSFYRNVILTNPSRFINNQELNDNFRCQPPGIYSCQLPDDQIFDSVRGICTHSFSIILYMRVNSFSFDYSPECNDPDKWWNYDTDSLYIKNFYVNLSSKINQIDGIKIVTNGINNKVKPSSGLTKIFYNDSKSVVVEIAKDFKIEVRPEVYRKSGTDLLWLNGEKTYSFTDDDNWNLSKTHKEIFEHVTPVNGHECKSYLEFYWRWIPIRG